MNLLQLFAFWITLLFGAFLIFCGFVMLFAPERARATIRKAGTTNLINYGELTLRMIPAASLILIADSSRLPFIFQLMGWFMLATSLVLFFVPPRIHHGFAAKGAEILKPRYIQLISPVSMIIGGLVIYNVM